MHWQDHRQGVDVANVIASFSRQRARHETPHGYQMDRPMRDVPVPSYSLIETSIGSDPAIVVINSALRTFRGRNAFPWHLRIGINCKLQGLNGMPTNEEIDTLVRLEEMIALAIEADRNTIFLARITARGERALLFRVHDPEVADQILKRLTALPDSLREWEYQMEYDVDWILAKPEMDLLAAPSRSNPP